MEEIKCPHCGKVFTIDESNYNSIVKQIRDHEFLDELKRREAEIFKKLDLEKELVKNDANKEIEKLKNDLKLKDSEYQSKLKEETSKLSQEIASLKERERNFDVQKDSALKELSAKKDIENVKSLNDAKEKINQLQRQLELNNTNKDHEIDLLKQEIKNKDTEKDLAVSDALSKAKDDKDKEVSDIRRKYEAYKIEAESKIDNLNNIYTEKLNNKDKELADKQEQVNYYKDLKTRMSTKMIGETLEQHCFNEFNRLRSLFPNASFDKDNDASSGSKGDFIYRETDESGVEVLSIMFEMKNEADMTATKHKNEDFFKELDKDRKEKKCEYAVLCSLLEADSEYYNAGIVDVSYKYEKMYVIRPQSFIPLITILRSAALNSLSYKKELMIERNNNLDVANFEENMNKFKDAFGKNYEAASKKFNDAIDEIDKSIAHLNKIKDALLSSDRQLRLANDKAQDLSIKKLTKNAPSVEKKFKEIGHE